MKNYTDLQGPNDRERNSGILLGETSADDSKNNEACWKRVQGSELFEECIDFQKDLLKGRDREIRAKILQLLASWAPCLTWGFLM